MSTYTSAQVQSAVVRGNWRGACFEVFGKLVPGSAALNDVYQMVLVPNGFMITDIAIDVGGTGLDSSTGLVWEFGDSATPARFITGATVGRSSAGGIQFANVGGTYGYQYAVNTNEGQFSGGNAGATILQIKITTAATTFVSGTTVAAMVQMYLDPQLGGFV